MLCKRKPQSKTERNTSCQTPQLPHIPNLTSENNSSTLCTLSDFGLHQLSTSASSKSHSFVTVCGDGGHCQGLEGTSGLPPSSCPQPHWRWDSSESDKLWGHTFVTLFLPTGLSTQVLVHSLPGAACN